MKKMIRFGLLLSIVAGSISIAATESSFPDKKKQKKSKTQKTQIVLLRDTTNCANYYEAKAIVKLTGHNPLCPKDCAEYHFETIILEKTLKTCPEGMLYNPRTLACDSAKNVVTCIHTPKCTNK